MGIKPAIFLDRDGTINVDKGYVYKKKDFEWIEGAKDSIKLFNDKGYYVFVVTNQSGIGRGFYNREDVEYLHSYINEDLSKINAKIDEFFYSPYHHSNNSNKFNSFKNLRKPNTGMLELACSKWPVNKEMSLLIGDSESDMECARNFGIKGFLFKEKNILNFVKKIFIQYIDK